MMDAESKFLAEDFTLVWLHENLFNLSNSLNLRTELQSVINDLNTFSKVDEAINYIMNASTERIFLITSSLFGENVVQQVHELQQIVYIYLFNEDQSKSNEQWWNRSYTKLRKNFDNIKELVGTISSDVDLCRSVQLPSFSIFDPNAIEKSTRDLTKDYASFMWFNLLMDTVLEMPQTINSKYEMLNQCSLCYQTDQAEQKKISAFQTTYKPENAIEWYTRDTFLFKLFNRAFRMQDIDVVYNFRFFLIDLHNELEKLYTAALEWLPDTFTVYRGVIMMPEEFQSLADNIGGLVAMNTFLSTSLDRDVALVFSGSGDQRPQKESVMFIITVDVEAQQSGTLRQTFAYLDNSANNDEKEILFSWGTIFQIESIVEGKIEQDPETRIDLRDETNVRIVNLTLKSDTDQKLAHLNLYLQEYIATTDAPGLLKLSEILLYVDQFNKAEQYCKLLLKELPSDHRDIGVIHNNIGATKLKRGKPSEALNDFKKAIKLYDAQERTSSFNLRAAVSYNNCGYAMEAMGDTKNAMEQYETALKIRRQEWLKISPMILSEESRRIPLEVANSHDSIGLCYMKQGEYENALSHLTKSLEIKEKHLPSNDFRVGDTLNLLCRYYYHTEQYGLLSKCCEHAFRILQQALPPSHSSLASIVNSLAVTTYVNADYSAALSNYQRALKVALDVVNQQSNHPFLLPFYTNIGFLYLRLDLLDKASEYLKMALSIASLSTPPDPNIFAVYGHLGKLHNERGDHSIAFGYFLKELEYCKRNLSAADPKLGIAFADVASAMVQDDELPYKMYCLREAVRILSSQVPPSHHLLGGCYNNIARIYNAELQHDQALEYFQKALQLDKAVLAPNHPDIATCYNNIACTLTAQGNFEEALENNRIALAIAVSVLKPGRKLIAILEENKKDIQERQLAVKK